MRDLIIITSALMVFAACNSNQKPASESDILLAQIDSLETILFAESEAPADVNAGMKLIRNYAKYYKDHKTDSIAVDMLFKAGEVSMGIGQGNMAVKYFKTVTEDHKEYSKAPEALFLTGFCEETINRDTTNARFYYEKFLEAYPNHKLAEDARFSIQNMSMSDEELIRMFEEKLKSES